MPSEMKPLTNRVFISWSGERSKAVAFALRDFIRLVVQAADPWVSERDIEAGARWGEEIAGQLNMASVGIICVTPENQERPWLNFEAGAISKQVGGNTRVSPYVFDMQKTDVKGPLAQFQIVASDQDGSRALIKMISSAVGSTLSEALLDKSFNAFWPRLKEELDKIGPAKERTTKRTDRDILNEILDTVRQLRRGQPRSVLPRYQFRQGSTRPVLWSDLNELPPETLNRLYQLAKFGGPDEKDSEAPKATPKSESD